MTKESDLQIKIIKTLVANPKVAWVMNVTSGTVKIGRHFIKLGKYHHNGATHYGVSDLLIQLSSGRLCALEIKLPDKEPSQLQYDFLEIVNDNGGLGAWCTTVEGAIEIINQEVER